MAMISSDKAILEICASSIHSALAAQNGGADRIELCQNLDIGGVTPSWGLIQIVKQRLSIPVHVLIRPRAGNFIYDVDEFDVMLADIQACHLLQVEGIAIGILDGDHQIDVPRMKQVVQAAHPMQVTFHRAFEDCIDKRAALEEIIACGCTRLLTCGGSSGTAMDNLSRFLQWTAQAQGRLSVIAANRVGPSDVKHLARVGVREFHASASRHMVKLKGEHLSKFDAQWRETDLGIVLELAEQVRLLHENRNVDSQQQQQQLPPPYSR